MNGCCFRDNDFFSEDGFGALTAFGALDKNKFGSLSKNFQSLCVVADKEFPVKNPRSLMAKHEDLPIPIFDSLEPMYGGGSLLEDAQLRFDNWKSKFQKVFGHPLEVVARSPGRVNLIGEHIDYKGYYVLPIAIRQDTIIAIQKNDDENILRIANVNDEKHAMCAYPDQVDFMSMLTLLALDLKNHKWGHYFVCGYKGYYDYAKSKGVDVSKKVGLDVLVDGVVPEGSELSSFATFFYSSTIAIMAAFRVNFPNERNCSSYM